MEVNKSNRIWIALLVVVAIIGAGLMTVSAFNKQKADQANADTTKSSRSIRLYDKDGAPIELVEGDGRPMIIYVFTISKNSAHYKEDLLALEEAYNEYGDEIDIIAINSIRYEVAAVEAVQDNIDELNLSFKVLYDTDKLTKGRYDLKQRPSTVLFNRDGEQVDIYTEALDHTKLLELMMEIK